MPESTLARTVDHWLPVAIYGALPTLGLAAGPSYAPLVFGLAVVQLLHGLATRHSCPAIDPALLRIAGAFLLLCWASGAWSIVPRHSLLNAVQMTAIIAGALIFIAQPPLPTPVADRLFQVALFATLAGVTAVVIDTVLDYPLEALVTAKPGISASTKYNRGIDYLVLIAWPQLAWFRWRRQWKAALVLAATIILALIVGASSAGRVAGMAGAVVLLLSWRFPRLVARVLPWGTMVFAMTLPVVLRAWAVNRMLLAPYIKKSGINRLEIWDYMTARIFEHPLLGWGLAGASSLQIHPDELSRYIYVSNAGTYPHNQWLQLWLELGLIGAFCGALFALMVLARVRAAPMQVRPFAYAAFTSAMAIACINFELTTDSWWAALAASGFLFITVNRGVTAQSTTA